MCGQCQQLVRAGDLVVPGGKAPGPHRRISGDIQRAVGLTAQLQGLGEQAGGVLREGDRLSLGVVDGVNLTGGAGDGEKLVQLLDPCGGVGQSLLSLGTVGGELHNGIHSKGLAVVLLGLAPGQQKQTKQKEEDTLHKNTPFVFGANGCGFALL